MNDDFGLDVLGALSCLTEDEREVVVDRFVLEDTQQEIGARLGLSRQRVAQLENKALAKLRGRLWRRAVAA